LSAEPSTDSTQHSALRTQHSTRSRSHTFRLRMLLLDYLQHRFPDSSKTTLRQLLQKGRVSVNGAMEKDAKLVLDDGDIVDVGPKPTQRSLPPGVTVLHEDDAVIVLLKPNGLLTVATERERENTLQAGLNRYLAGGGRERIHVVHRLDRETSGVLVFAKTFPAREALK